MREAAVSAERTAEKVTSEVTVCCSLKEIGEKLLAAEDVLIFPHVNMDGDGFGSSVALCRALRNLGKDAYIVLDERVQRNLQFLDKCYCISISGKRLFDGEDCSLVKRSCRCGGYDRAEAIETMKSVDISVCVDCGDEGRLGSRLALFKTATTTICIDHHHTNKPFCMFNHVDEGAAATGELIFQLLKEMGTKPDKEIGEALFTAISTDSGKFHYSNTRAFTHQMAAELYSWGIDVNAISVELYQNESFAKKKVVAEVLSTVELFAGGKGAVAYITEVALDRLGATLDDTENVVDEIRNIAGVEIAAFLKETGENVTGVSLRVKTHGNVAAIAEAFGGGGHVKAAGCTIDKPAAEAVEEIKKAIEKALE